MKLEPVKANNQMGSCTDPIGKTLVERMRSEAEKSDDRAMRQLLTDGADAINAAGAHAAGYAAGVAAERERCAAMAENVAFENRELTAGRGAAMRVAAVIRGA